MSFGFSPTDFITLISLTSRAYKGWNAACGEYGDITSTLFSFQTVLRRVHRHVEQPSTESAEPFVRPSGTLRDDLGEVLRTSNQTIIELQSILQKYPSLKTDHKSNWERLRLGCRNLSGLQLRLSRDLNIISTLLLDQVLFTIDLYRQDVTQLSSTIKGGVAVALENIVESKTGDTKTMSTAFTTYEQDSEEVWRDLRREMIKIGFKSDEILANKDDLFAFARNLVGTREQHAATGTETKSKSSTAGSNSQGVTMNGAAPSVLDFPPRRPFGAPQIPKSSATAFERNSSDVRHRSREQQQKTSLNGTQIPGAHAQSTALPHRPVPHHPQSPRTQHPGRPPPGTTNTSHDTSKTPPSSTLQATSTPPKQTPLSITYSTLSLEEQSPMLIHLCLPLGWQVCVHRQTLKVSFRDLFADSDEPMFLHLPPRVLPELMVTPAGWFQKSNRYGRIYWKPWPTRVEYPHNYVRYSFPSETNDEPTFRYLANEEATTPHDTKHRLEDINGCFRVEGSFFVDFTIENPCQVLQWTWEMESANPGLLQSLREWASFPQESANVVAQT